jgi:biopolymer transport protein ExbD
MDIRNKGTDKPASLTLTPLLDMFTIILIFLIVSFESEDHGFEPNKEVQLPTSSARSVFKPAVNIAITPDSLLVEKEKTVELDNFSFAPKYHDQQKIPPLVTKLEGYYAQITGETEAESGEEIDIDKPIVLVQADKKLQYDTLYLVLRSAAMAGFVKYRLAIMKK